VFRRACNTPEDHSRGTKRVEMVWGSIGFCISRCSGKSEKRELCGLLLDKSASKVVHGPRRVLAQRKGWWWWSEKEERGADTWAQVGWMAGLYRCDRETLCLVAPSIYGLFGSLFPEQVTRTAQRSP
jgi:hypothetical protein